MRVNARLEFQIGVALLLLLTTISLVAKAEEILDRTVAVVGDRAITLSELEEQLALEALDQGVAAVRTPQRYREVVERLIRLRLVQREMSLAGFSGTMDDKVQRQWEAMKENFGGDAAFQKALAQQGLMEETVRRFLRQQLDFQQFVDFRFRTGLAVTREEVESYYEKEYKARLPAAVEPPSLEQVYAKLEAELLERRVDPMLEDWINRVRAQTRITIVDTALKSSGATAP
jgi:hypothetical protein